MMRSLSSAVGGLRSHQTKMDVIGNNIANINTYGFKSSRATFSDVYYQNLGSASAPGATMGGTNPTQIGYGATVATIDVLNTQSGMASTDRALDVYINGDGMIATKDANGNLRYTRLGILGFDAAGNLVDSNGNFVMGFPINASTGQPIVNPDGSIDADRLTGIKVSTEMLDQMTGISIGTTGEIVGVMPGEIESSLNSGRPNWLTSLTVPSGSSLVGDIKVTMATDQSITSDELYSNWIYDVKAAAGGFINGKYDFTYDRQSKTITATDANTGATYTGLYKKGTDIELKSADGTVGFTVTTDMTNIPGTGSGVENMGSLTYAVKEMITVSGRDAGGNYLSQSLEFDTSSPSASSLTFPEVGGVTLYIDPNKISAEMKSVLTYDSSNTFNYVAGPPASGWLKGVDYTADNTRSGNVTVEIGIKPNATNSIGQSGYDALGFLYPDVINSIVNAAAPAAGNYSIDIIATGNPGEFRVRINTPTPIVSDAFTLGAGGEVKIGAVSVGKVPAINVNLQAASFANAVKVTDQNIITVSDGTGVLGSIVYDGVSQPIITDPEGNNIMLDVDVARLNAAFAATSVSAIVGSLSPKEFNDWNYAGNVAFAKVGDGEKVIIGCIALAKVPNMAAMQQEGTSYFVTTANSGEPTFLRPGTQGTGTLQAGNLEMSNVDISKEFTDMITTQRGFQANTRIITVSDEMLQELVNLKR